jgi:hypothetical protein
MVSSVSVPVAIKFIRVQNPCALHSWQVRMDARGEQLMREWWTLKLAKEADEAELASMSEQMSKIMPILIYL